jgi:hypothetical protein
MYGAECRFAHVCWPCKSFGETGACDFGDHCLLTHVAFPTCTTPGCSNKTPQHACDACRCQQQQQQLPSFADDDVLGVASMEELLKGEVAQRHLRQTTTPSPVAKDTVWPHASHLQHCHQCGIQLGPADRHMCKICRKQSSIRFQRRLRKRPRLDLLIA